MISIRSGVEADHAFVYSTMLKGLYYGCPLYSQIEQRAFFDNYSQIVKRLLGHAELRVACLADEPETVVGYALVRGPVLDFVFVKKAWRGNGIANRLCADINTVTHLTKTGQSIKLKKKLIFNPFA